MENNTSPWESDILGVVKLSRGSTTKETRNRHLEISKLLAN